MINNTEIFGKIRYADVLFRRATFMVSHPGETEAPNESKSARGRGHFKILHALDQNDGMSQRELAAQLEIRPQSLTEALVRLEQEGLISRTRSERDKREQFVRITPAGREHAQQVYQIRRQALEMLFSGLNEDEKQQLGALLDKLIETFKEKEANPDV